MEEEREFTFFNIYTKLGKANQLIPENICGQPGTRTQGKQHMYYCQWIMPPTDPTTQCKDGLNICNGPQLCMEI